MHRSPRRRSALALLGVLLAPALALASPAASGPALRGPAAALRQDGPATTPPGAAAAPVASASQETRQVPAPLVPVPEPVALVGGTVFSMDGDARELRPVQATILVEDGRVLAVGPDLAVPAGVRTVDVTGLYVVPGLIDGAISHDAEQDALYVAHGVTLARDTGNRMAILGERRPTERARVPGPDLYVCGKVLDGPHTSNTEALRLGSPEEAARGLRTLFDTLAGRAREHGLDEHAYDLDYLGFQRGLDPATWRAVLDTAHGLGVDVWGPLPEGVDLAGALAAGQDGFFGLDALLPPGANWVEVDPSAFGAGAAALAAGDAAVTPLLYNYARRLDGGPLDLEDLLRQLSPFYDQSWRADREQWTALREGDDDRLERALAHAGEALLALWKAGVPLVPGSGAPHPGLFPGHGLIDELESWTRAGVPSGAALHAATAGAADALGLPDRGRIRAGAVADLVVVGADPRSTLASLRDPELVVLRGRVLERDELYGLVDATVEFQDAARAVLAAPLEVPPIDLAEVAGLEPRLEGVAEVYAFESRVSAERFAVYQLADGRRAYASRIVSPASLVTPALHIQLVQIFKGDRLDEFRLFTQPQVDDVPEDQRDRYLTWEVRGGMIASTGLLSIQRRTQHGSLPTVPSPDPITLVDLADVQTAMILGRHGREGVLFALDIVGETFEPVADRWQFAIGTDDHQMQFGGASGVRGAFQLDARGVPLSLLRTSGNGATRVELLEVHVHDEAWAPLPEARVFVPAGK